MERDSSKQAGWLDTAVAGIRFGPDRAAVRAELEAHLEDRAADLLRLFPELTPEEAVQGVTIPFHPGAEAYYKSKGVEVPENK